MGGCRFSCFWLIYIFPPGKLEPTESPLVLPPVLPISCPSHFTKGHGGLGFPLSRPPGMEGENLYRRLVFLMLPGSSTFSWPGWGGVEGMQVGLGTCPRIPTRIPQPRVTRPWLNGESQGSKGFPAPVPQQSQLPIQCTVPHSRTNAYGCHCLYYCISFPS